MTDDSFVFSHSVNVRWCELDPQGVVFFPNYLMYADLAATEYFRAIGFGYPERFRETGVDLCVVHTETDYHHPARFDEKIALRVRTLRIGRKSIKLLIRVERGEISLAEITLIYAVIAEKPDAEPGIPPSLTQCILEYEAIRPIDQV